MTIENNTDIKKSLHHLIEEKKVGKLFKTIAYGQKYMGAAMIAATPLLMLNSYIQEYGHENFVLGAGFSAGVGAMSYFMGKRGVQHVKDQLKNLESKIDLFKDAKSKDN